MQPQFSLRHFMKEFLSCFQQTSTASIGQNNLTTRSKYHYVMHSKQSIFSFQPLSVDKISEYFIAYPGI